jgi:hypothetical protein
MVFRESRDILLEALEQSDAAADSTADLGIQERCHVQQKPEEWDGDEIVKQVPEAPRQRSGRLNGFTKPCGFFQ